MAFDKGADVAFKLACRGMNATAELLAGEFSKPFFDLVDPRRRGWREVDMVMRPPRQPFSHECGFVGRIIVYDDVNIESGRHLRVDRLKEVEELGRPV